MGALALKMKDLIPRQMFEVVIRRIGNKIVAQSSPIRKNVRQGGGHHPQTQAPRKAEGGKKRMKRLGKVKNPQEAFLAILKVE